MGVTGADATVVDSLDGKGAMHYAAKYNKHECMNAIVQAVRVNDQFFYSN
jgi:hypothetical protein